MALFVLKVRIGSNSKSNIGRKRLEADEIPPCSSSSSNMNVAGDIAQLSYKELQALALRYRVPGNIKKKVLVKVLQAARSGNEAEFSRLLQELRKNRKRKTRKPKDSKLGITSTPLHSPEYVMADDDYYCQQQQQQPQQQPPYQWVGAEEEIMSRDDDNKIPHYDEFKQFLLKRIQREFQTCDTNNNQDLSIMDLRTATGISPNMQAISLDVSSYSKANIINNADPLAMSNMDRPNYQVLKESESNSQGPFLLKRMLQAPVGANLGEIASSLFWASNLLDNSDTLTAESESNENEDQLEATVNATEYYGLLKNAKGEFLLNEANLRNVDALVPQGSGVLTNEDQYRYPGDLDNRQNYQNWTVTSVMEMPENDLQSSKMFHTIYYNNTDSAVAAHATDNNLPYQYQTNTETCNGSQNFLNFDTGYTTGNDMMTPNDTTDMYYLQNSGKNGEDIGAGYFRGVEPLVQNCAQQNVYANDQQTFSNDIRGTSEVTYQYLYPRLTQETNHTLHERLENQQTDNNIMTGVECGINQATNAASMQGLSNGTVEPFWPKWTTQISNNLENILNYNVSKQVDYTKLGQTSCVYCYMAPIVSQRSSLANNTCSQSRRYTAEQRQHSFSAYWMLYNDTSQGMRMTNMSNDHQPEQSVTTATTTTTMHASTMPSNDDLRETDIEIPINDVWMNQYEPAGIAEDINVQAPDSLFCNVTAVRIDDITTPDIAKT
ncbi:uncharacterized protein LOC116844860 isoform X2 [Odontomachus brunneus]|uniref:uncharacterized protein LOC116844860 isoform X2 n=1 Tax=Odontomachus brunneus TaxID=486640 RepID=UPI0013F20269|nr:uncharacterized protein LOC116844860 isoform X2 [Odontomachus brunneus]